MAHEAKVKMSLASVISRSSAHLRPCLRRERNITAASSREMVDYITGERVAAMGKNSCLGSRVRERV